MQDVDDQQYQLLEAYLDQHYEFRCNAKYRGIFGALRAEIDRKAAEEQEQNSSGARTVDDGVVFGSDPWAQRMGEIEAEIRQDRESFSAALMKLIAAKGADPVDVYKRAMLDRKLFSKIRSNSGYIPSKRTVLALAFGLRLTLDETRELLALAGFALSRSILSDVIVEYFLSHGVHDLMEVNIALHAYDQQPLC